jgi:enoyl-CoA hydratase/carnithine racemase
VEHVLYEKEGGIAYITLNQPERLNAIGPQATEELARIWIDLKNDDKVLVGILSGKGKAFCAGVDLGKTGSEVASWSMERSMIWGKYRMGPSQYSIWKPLIAAVHGYVLGAGFYLSMECDIRVASEDTEFGLPEPNFGLPTLFAPYMRDHLPRGLSMELLLLGDRISSKRAYEMGFVNRIVERKDLLSSAKEIAEKLTQKSPLSLRVMKEVYYRCYDNYNKTALVLIDELFTPAMNSQDVAEGRRALIEKRQPNWSSKKEV